MSWRVPILAAALLAGRAFAAGPCASDPRLSAPCAAYQKALSNYIGADSRDPHTPAGQKLHDDLRIARDGLGDAIEQVRFDPPPGLAAGPNSILARFQSDIYQKGFALENLKQLSAQYELTGPGNDVGKGLGDLPLAKTKEERKAAEQNTPEVQTKLAQAEIALGNRTEAAAAVKKALELDPGNKEARKIADELQAQERAQSNQERAQAKADALKLDFANGPREESGGKLREPGGGMGGPPVKGGIAVPGASVTVPAPGVVPPDVRTLFLKAKAALERGDDEGGLRALREAVDLDPKDEDAWEKIAEISNKGGDYDAATAAADKALALDPKDARAWRAKSYAEFQLGHYQAALDAAEHAVALEPGNGLGVLYRAMAEEKLGLKDKAIADYRTAARLAPELLPAALEGLKRLGAGSAPAGAWGGWSAAKRAGVVGGSGLLLLLGLIGTTRRRRAQEAATAAAAAARGPAIVPEAATVALGAVIGGHYRVVGELGRGGMGAVYRARDESLQRDVAIKQLLRDGRGDAAEREGLLREARLVAQLRHPHIAEIYSVITDADPLLVFEHVDGESLDKVLKRSLKLAPKRARRIVEEVSAALAYAHARGIIHRDLKPSNVMIAEGGAAKVMDFGIAHQASGSATRVTRAASSGTPAYMAPEQALGSVSKASDVYALGVLAYELLTGLRPFDGPDFLEPKLRGEFPPATARNPDLPPAVDEFFARALAPDPTKRFAGTPELAAALAAALEKVPTET